MKLKSFEGKFYIDLIILLSIFLLDRISKIFVINYDKNISSEEIFSSKFLDIHLIWNKGIAFGLFSFDQGILYNLFTAFISLIVLIILYLTIKSKGVAKYALLMILSGASGNLYDRIFYKAVPDFIDFHINGFHWFIFNISDIFISIGVIIMIFLEISSKDKKKYE
tara:strand:+ start:694 stop:1191 length:498 start_codon:yes stop_codon:yes gene_type:complete